MYNVVNAMLGASARKLWENHITAIQKRNNNRICSNIMRQIIHVQTI